MALALALIYVGVGIAAGVAAMLPFAGGWPGWKRLVPYALCIIAGLAVGLLVSLPAWRTADLLWNAS